MATQRKNRKLTLQEARSRRLDMLVGLPFFFLEKLFSWPVVVICLGYMFFVEGAEHFAGVDTSLMLGAAIDLGADDWLQWSIIVILVASNIVTGVVFRRYVSSKGQREKRLEDQIDPNRSTSGLDKTGNPPRQGV